MKLYLDLFFVLFLGYFIVKFIQVLIKLKQTPIYPISKSDVLMIRKHAEQKLNLPRISEQKTGIIIYTVMLVFVTIMFLLSVLFHTFSWSIYLLLFLLMAQNNNYFNLFAVYEDGILSDNRFISWDKIKSFQFIPIDMNHRFYGYSKEVNDKFKLKIKTSFSSTYCIVISDRAKEKLNQILIENSTRLEEVENLKEQHCEK